MEKSMKRLKDEPFDNQEIFKFLQNVSKDLDEMLVVKEKCEQDDNTISRKNSIETLSLSIRNRMKVEAEEHIKTLPKNSIMEQLSKFEHILNVVSKIEE